MSEYRNYSEDFIYDSSAYGKHVSAMTGEKLHSKSDIAAELAYRDDQIETLEFTCKSLSKQNKGLADKLEEAEGEIAALNGELENLNHLLRTYEEELVDHDE